MKNPTPLAALLLLCAASIAQDHTIPQPDSSQVRARPPVSVTNQGNIWIVQCAGPGPDHSRLRAAYAEGESAARIAALIAASELAASQRMAALRAAIAEIGGRVVRSWWIVDALAVSLPPGTGPEVLRSLPGVGRVDPNNLVLGTSIGAQPIEHAISTLGHNTAAAHVGGYTGSARGGQSYQSIAVLDAELLAAVTTAPAAYRHHGVLRVGGAPTAASRVIADAQVGSSVNSTVPFDHGNAVAAIAAGARLTGGTTFTGASNGHAPGADLVSVNVAVATPAAAYPGNANPQLLPPISDAVTLLSAWQWVLANRATYGIRVAVNSFGGDPNPAAPVQQALDACADVGDIVVVVPSGNEGNSRIGSLPGVPNPCWDSQYAANGVAVAAAGAHTRAVPSWVSNAPLTPANTVQPLGSSNLPTPAGYERQYPDMVAAGLDMVLPFHTNEAAFTMNSGTSMAAPNVAGSAFLWLVGPDGAAVLPARTALMARAAMLASAEASGFLRSDWLTVDSTSLGAVQDQVTSNPTTGSTYTRMLPVVAGKTYSVAVAWKRTDYSTNPDWANLDLAVTMAGASLGSSASAVGAGNVGVRRTWERVVFTAPSSGTVAIDVVFTHVPTGAAVTHAFAATELPVVGGPGSTRARFEPVAASQGATCTTAGLGSTSVSSFSTLNITGTANAYLKNCSAGGPQNMLPGLYAFQTTGGGYGTVVDFSFEIDCVHEGYIDVYSYSTLSGGYWNPCTTTISPTPQGGTIVDTCRIYHRAGTSYLSGRLLSGGYLVFDFPATVRWWKYRPWLSPSQWMASPWTINNCYSAWPYVAWTGSRVPGVPPTIGNAPFSFGGAATLGLNQTFAGQMLRSHWEWRFTYRIVDPAQPGGLSPRAVVLGTTGVPRIGSDIGLLSAGSYPNTAGSGWLLVGFWLPGSPQISQPLQPGSSCSLLVNPEIIVPSAAFTGTYSTLIPVPNDPGLAGLAFDMQQYVLDSAGVPASSNAWRAVLGF